MCNQAGLLGTHTQYGTRVACPAVPKCSKLPNNRYCVHCDVNRKRFICVSDDGQACTATLNGQTQKLNTCKSLANMDTSKPFMGCYKTMVMLHSNANANLAFYNQPLPTDTTPTCPAGTFAGEQAVSQACMTESASSKSPTACTVFNAQTPPHAWSTI